MNVTYKFWEKDSGFEEIQAKLFNENNPNQPQPVTAKDIADRFEREKIDPKTVRYAFSDNDKSLAYIQARDYTEIKETHLGYPWATADCPEEVQHKLFDEMLEYLKTRDTGFDIRVNGYVANEKIMNFLKSKPSLKKVGKNYRKEFDVKQLEKLTASEEVFQIRKATKNDVNILVELIKEDGRYSGQFSKDEDGK